MAERPVDSDAHVSRRVRRQHRSRRRWRGITSIVALVVVLVVFGLVITETVRFGGGDTPSLARTVDSTRPRSTGSATTTTLPGRPCRAPLTDAAPLRLWMGGDSLAGSLGPALGTITGATGVVQPQFDSRVSSGLTNSSFFNWPSHAVAEMNRLDPEIAVFIIGANDFAAPMNTANDADGQPAWKATYTGLIEDMLTAFGADTRTVVWIASPPFKDDRNAQIEQLDDARAIGDRQAQERCLRRCVRAVQRRRRQVLRRHSPRSTIRTAPRCRCARVTACTSPHKVASGWRAPCTPSSTGSAR